MFLSSHGSSTWLSSSFWCLKFWWTGPLQVHEGPGDCFHRLAGSRYLGALPLYLRPPEATGKYGPS